ncbi:MAG TPA: LAGLIDADG family homing endonuclease [Actinomycetota bacterium]
MAKTERAMEKGLAVKRYFTSQGKHPYDEIEWDVRDAIIPNYKEGGNAFEQRAVEFPSLWSLNATNIVAQKYFRGPLGSPQRESSVRQLIDRVADTITAWGWKDGYFAAEDDRQIFNAELKHILVTQKAAFNSPVWFNVGSEEHPQCSACQPGDALISTPGGMIPIGEIVKRDMVGLSVFDSSGETKVVATKDNGIKPVYRILLRNGAFVEATGDHVVRAVGERRTRPAWYRVDELVSGMRMHLHPHRGTTQPPAATEAEVSEAALAGWLQADGFVGQYETGTNRSLTIEFFIANADEEVWVKEHLDVVFPNAHRKVRPVDGNPGMNRIRLYGEHLREFVERWELLNRRHDIRVPVVLWTASKEASRAYLRSVFQSDGFVGRNNGSTRIGFAVISERWTEDVQNLLLRHGIYSRRFHKVEKREDRSDIWEVGVSYRSERKRFHEEIGFIGFDKSERLRDSLALVGKDCPDIREEEIVEIILLGDQQVFDIQTESGEYLTNNIVVHNCFILAVDDKMSSILNWYVEEGTIFKGGSGSGINLSSIRSSKEKLSSGGEASGPVSFMRGADASAGTIKSGGKTRRAAKMVILNVDHPDVEDFVWCKAVEERKARVLRDNGFDMDLDGSDSHSIQYQNANNSVRVTDEFMQAYLNDADWDLKAVQTGETVEQVRARHLMRQIAQAAWECADPGMQYDTTINDWHTCPASGRINASNPCCFIGETLVVTEFGSISIEIIEKMARAGEQLPRVLTRDLQSGKSRFTVVSNAWIAGEAEELVVVRTRSGQRFECTPEHRFLSNDQWIEAQNLQAGMALTAFDSDGKEVQDAVADVARLCPEEPVPVFDLEIADTHNFVVTGDGPASTGVVVHNSEYMHLDNSACNLASLNLMKFLDADLNFDIQAFRHAIDIVFLAQEILVSNSSYPTEKIGKNAEDYRELGLGYANLGALLMSRGVPYDSEAGRAWAGAITALMTGWAYRVSAQVAEKQGPYNGYPPNREAHLRVMRKHRAAVDDIDPELVPEGLLQAAKGSWDDAITFGEQHGYRNSQATVLAPTGCLVGGSLVPTERGLVRLRSLGDPDGAKWQDLGIDVATDDGVRRATQFYVNGSEPVVDVRTRRGYRIQGTTTHRIKVVEPSGAWVWKRFADLTEGDRVPLALDSLVGRPQVVTLPPLGEGYWTGEHHVRVPDRVTSELAELVGYFMGDGSLHSRGLRFCVAAENFDVVEHLTRLGKSLFGIEAAVTDKQGYVEVAFHSVRLVQWWQACGFAKYARPDGKPGKGWLPHVPDAILHSNDRESYAAFLRGLYEADGTVTAGAPSWSTTSLEFSQDVQSLMLAMGYPTTRKFDTTGWGRSQLAVLRHANSSRNERWLEEIGFLSGRKNARVTMPAASQSGKKDRIPMLREMIDRLAPENDRLRRVLLMESGRSGSVSRAVAEQLQERVGDDELGHLLGFFYDEIASAELGEEELTYDLSVPDNVTYVANGFVSHNTIGLMMDCDTTGIEPDLALVKTKKLVGGGTMRIVNQTVPRALTRLGYDPQQVEEITAYIHEHNMVHDAPHVRPEHYPVFDCAMGEHTIHYMGHVKMMAGVQPFISGAISKCVTGETLLTTEDGLIRIASLHDGEEPDSYREHRMLVASLGGQQKAESFYFGGVRPVRQIRLRSGQRIVGTPNHRVLVAADGELQWRYLDEIAAGEYVATQYGADMWASVPPSLTGFAASPAYGNQRKVSIPAEMTGDLAFLLGAYAAEGHTTPSNWTITITNADEAVLAKVVSAWRTVFGVEARIDRQPERCPGVVVSSKTIVEFFDWLGCGHRASAKRIPDLILRSPKQMVLAFLQGLWLDAYTARMGSTPKWAICLDSPAMLDDLQAVLTNLGIVHSRIEKYNKEYGKSYGEVYAVGEQAVALIRTVPFVESDKRERAEGRLEATPAQSTADVVPGVAPRELYNMIPRGRSGRNGYGFRKEFSFLLDPRTRRVSRRTLERVAQIPGVALPEWLRTVLSDGLHFSPVESVADAGEREVYDIAVPSTEAFVANGIVNHNTVNMPESATVEEVEDLLAEGWRLGLKALALYRDNCKVAQPLSADKKKTAMPAAAAEPVEVPKTLADRKRLPKSRPSRTISFRVGDQEGYMTAGMYPDDGVGEVFLKVSKQGSTVSGVMDALAIAVSIGLQYGVPLEAYVSKFINMRFEPLGMTDDADIRMAQSLVDYIFRRLAIEFLPEEVRADLGIRTTEERKDEVAGKAQQPMQIASAPGTVPPNMPSVKAADAPYCYNCGNQMRPAGSCFVCEACGSTSGCS